MSDDVTTLEAPTPRRLLWTTLVALAVAAVLLVLFVLPAEYDIDPTGLGALMGIRDLAGAAESVDLTDAPAGSSVIKDDPPAEERRVIELAPGEEMELKMTMMAGDTVVFSWVTDGEPIYSDFHADSFTGFEEIRYREDEAVNASNGAVTAPFAGNHGWYWRNDSEVPVTVTLDVDGYWGAFKEMRAGGQAD